MKIKAVLTIIISLFVGFVFGFLTSGQFMKREMRNKHSHSYNEMFIHRTLGVIEPTESQKDSVMPIIVNYAEKTMFLKNKVSGEFDSLIHKMNIDLKPYLSNDQYNKLEGIAKDNRRKYGR